MQVFNGVLTLTLANGPHVATILALDWMAAAHQTTVHLVTAQWPMCSFLAGITLGTTAFGLVASQFGAQGGDADGPRVRLLPRAVARIAPRAVAGSALSRTPRHAAVMAVPDCTVSACLLQSVSAFAWACSDSVRLHRSL